MKRGKVSPRFWTNAIRRNAQPRHRSRRGRPQNSESEQQLADVTLKLRNQFLDRQIAALTQKASQPEISDAEKIELLHEQQKLREQKRAPLSPLQN